MEWKEITEKLNWDGLGRNNEETELWDRLDRYKVKTELGWIGKK